MHADALERFEQAGATGAVVEPVGVFHRIEEIEQVQNVERRDRVREQHRRRGCHFQVTLLHGVEHLVGAAQLAGGENLDLDVRKIVVGRHLLLKIEIALMEGGVLLAVVAYPEHLAIRILAGPLGPYRQCRKRDR